MTHTDVRSAPSIGYRYFDVRVFTIRRMGVGIRTYRELHSKLSATGVSLLVGILLVGCRGSANPAAEDLAEFRDVIAIANDPESVARRDHSDFRQIEELKRACMAEKGFDYIPIAPEEYLGPVRSRDQESTWRSEWGFGLTTWYGNPAFEAEVLPDPEGPNTAIVDAMTPAEAIAYSQAMNGAPEEQPVGIVDPSTGVVTVEEGVHPGCAGEAQREFDRSRSTEEWRLLEADIAATRERVAADPRMVAADQEWSRCMLGEGYAYEGRSTLLDEIVGGALTNRLRELISGSGEILLPETEVDMDEVRSLQREEIRLALADLECSAPWEEVHLAVSVEYEDRFIEDHYQTLATLPH